MIFFFDQCLAFPFDFDPLTLCFFPVCSLHFVLLFSAGPRVGRVWCLHARGLFRLKIRLSTAGVAHVFFLGQGRDLPLDYYHAPVNAPRGGVDEPSGRRRDCTESSRFPCPPSLRIIISVALFLFSQPLDRASPLPRRPSKLWPRVCRSTTLAPSSPIAFCLRRFVFTYLSLSSSCSTVVHFSLPLVSLSLCLCPQHLPPHCSEAAIFSAFRACAQTSQARVKDVRLLRCDERQRDRARVSDAQRRKRV